MRIWRYSNLDSFMLMFSLFQFAATFFLAAHWGDFSLYGRLGCFTLLVFMMTYNIIVVSHLFTHTPWFFSRVLNCFASMMNSVNIGQSVQVYQLKHVRNHHRYNNDQKGLNGKTKDYSSTYQDGENNEHDTLVHYAFLGAISTLRSVVSELLTIFRFCRVSADETVILDLVAKSPENRNNELRQVRLDRLAHFAGICLFFAISWQWTLYCYLPAFYLALSFVNIQNYYEHFGAMPTNRHTDSVSYYGRIYNCLTFNDGYHQEHHLRPGEHWTMMPSVRSIYFSNELDRLERIISPVPALFGFLHFNRKKLHISQEALQLVGDEGVVYD